MKLVVTGGGTGGHLFPGIAIAQEFCRRGATEVLFIGTGRHLDQTALSQYGYTVKTIHCSGLKGGSVITKLTSLIKLPFGLLEALLLLWKFKPSLVLGVGGYVTGPVLLAAKILGIASCIHEQNSVPGLANRKLGSLVDRVFLSIPGSEAYFSTDKCYMGGNPVRQEILAVSGNDKGKGHNLLVLGGSLGAHSLNTLLPAALQAIKQSLPPGFIVIHQTGKADEELVRKAYENAAIPAQVSSFIKDMAAAYQQAELVVCRAGATTIAELTALGLPAILVPYPFAADDHQRLNGDYLVREQAALMFVEQDLTAEKLASEILALMSDHEARKNMGRQALNLAKKNAAEDIVDQCMRVIKKNMMAS